MDGDYWSETQQLIGSLITKPKMSEKYLRKPPFRFLHDIVMEVVRVSGFAANLFTDAEQDAASMSDKNSKIDFLSKIISATYYAIGMDGCEVLPNKIVAGLECDKTNAWLCDLYAAATSHKGNSAMAVQRVLSGETTISKPVKKSAPAPAPPPAPASPPKQEKKSPAAKSPSTEQKRQQEAEMRRREEQEAALRRQQEEQQRQQQQMQAEQERLQQLEQAKVLDNSASAKKEEPPAAEVVQPAAPQGQRERPRTAGRKPPKVTAKKAEEIAAAALPAAVNIIADDEQDEEEEAPAAAAPTSGVTGNYNIRDEAGHGMLVRDILVEKKALEEKQAVEQQEQVQEGESQGIVMGKLRRGKKTRSTTSTGEESRERRGSTDMTSGGAGGAASRAPPASDVQKLQETIQLLCQAANPLTKSMDLVHADISSMAKELDYWKQEYRNALEQCRTELKTTEEVLSKSYQSVAEAEERIQEETSKIHSSRARVLKNDKVIQHLLNSVVSSHG
ncbi:unnamed protein product [Amoebophrya sp. A25]|nr:unnamed protein product [Amoebophrya sp. A25]|eukprot:GSA25T00002008001.1